MGFPGMLDSASRETPVVPGIEASSFPLDERAYLNSLRHLGEPCWLPRAQLWVLRRPIGHSGWADLLASVPYSRRLAEVDPTALREDVRESDAVALVGTLRPGTPGPAGESWAAAGFSATAAKAHFVYDGTRPLAEFSPRTRQHLRAGQRKWQLRWEPLAACQREMAEAFGELQSHKKMITLSRHPAEHFSALAEIPGLACVSAYDKDGWGAGLVVASGGGEHHALVLAGRPRAYRHDAFYAVLAYATARCAETGTKLFLGGAPAGREGQGVGQFKQRFANDRAESWLVHAIACPRRCEELIQRHGRRAWQPPYRGPFEEEVFPDAHLATRHGAA